MEEQDKIFQMICSTNFYPLGVKLFKEYNLSYDKLIDYVLFHVKWQDCKDNHVYKANNDLYSVYCYCELPFFHKTLSLALYIGEAAPNRTIYKVKFKLNKRSFFEFNLLHYGKTLQQLVDEIRWNCPIEFRNKKHMLYENYIKIRFRKAFRRQIDLLYYKNL